MLLIYRESKILDTVFICIKAGYIGSNSYMLDSTVARMNGINAWVHLLSDAKVVEFNKHVDGAMH